MKGKPTVEQRTEFCQWFATTYATALATLAREHARTEGRGAVVIVAVGDFRTWRTNPDDGSMASLSYVSERAATEPGGIGWPDAATAGMVQRYEPASQMVLVFDLGGDITTIRARMVEPALNETPTMRA